MSALKNAVKTILPSDVLNYGRKLRDQSQLSSLEKLKFDPANLAASNSLDIETHLESQDAQQPWENDHKAISAIYGDSDEYGGVNPGDRQAIYKLIYALKPKTVLEVGTHIGASTLYISRALKAQNENAKLTTVDILDVNAPDGPWSSLGLDGCPQDFAKRLDCEDQITFVQSPCVPHMKNTNEKYDLIFLDGDHSASSVYQEISAALDILNDGGIILMHDYYPHGKAIYADNTIITGPYLAVERIREENPTIAIHPLGALPWATKQGSNITSLAILSRV